MLLVEEGRVGLTRRVCDYIPEFQGDAKDAVYVHHLLTHTSGLQSSMDPEEMASDLATQLERPRRDPALHRVADAYVQLACERALQTPPGEQMFYDSLNYELLGEIVRRVSGRSLHDFVHERIFDPLAMAVSHVTVPDELVDRVVRATSESPMAVMWEFPMLHVATGGGGGFYSTALDMAVFGQAFLDRRRAGARILGPAAMEEMITNQIPGVPGVLIDESHDEASWGYGWGIACHEKWSYFPTHPPGTFQHGGLSGVYLWCDPTNDVVGAYFSAVTKEIAPEILLWPLDLFVNTVTAAIEA
jgi:CubicO group peptidase (beta-lactamase class C family)